MTIDDAAQKAGNVLTRFGPTLVQGLLTIGLFILGSWLNGQAQAQAAFNTRLSAVEIAVSATESDVRLLKNTIDNRGAARDQQVTTISSQVSVVSARLDHVEQAFGDKLDKIVESVSTMQSDIAGIVATINIRK